MSFPSDFVWGAAAAAYQIEGAAQEDGKGQSVWDVFCRRPGAIWNGDSGEVACDHYHRFREDVALMKQIGIKAYRLSICWPRVIPQGTGAVNAKGLDFYDQLIDALVAADITPYITLFHWDYPQALFERGGWLNRDSVEWFGEYTNVVVSRLSDRVRHWITLNEPQCQVILGHQDGRSAPGTKLSWEETLRVAHHTLMAHGRSVQVIRAVSKQKAEVGYAPVGLIRYPATDRPEDIATARDVMFGVHGKHLWNSAWWMDPVYLGHYPEDGLKVYGADVPKIAAGDMELIHQPLDFFGINIYHGDAFRRTATGGFEQVPIPTGAPRTRINWPMVPECMYWGPKFYYERYKLPIHITENGISGSDWVALDGGVHDPQRIDYTHRHLLQLHRAMAEGAKVHGYFHWSIMDNFEWTDGYKQRFGLIHVDYTTQKRTMKDSAAWYKKVIATNGSTLGG